MPGNSHLYQSFWHWGLDTHQLIRIPSSSHMGFVCFRGDSALVGQPWVDLGCPSWANPFYGMWSLAYLSPYSFWFLMWFLFLFLGTICCSCWCDQLRSGAPRLGWPVPTVAFPNVCCEPSTGSIWPWPHLTAFLLILKSCWLPGWFWCLLRHWNICPLFLKLLLTMFLAWRWLPTLGLSSQVPWLQIHVVVESWLVISVSHCKFFLIISHFVANSLIFLLCSFWYHQQWWSWYPPDNVCPRSCSQNFAHSTCN